MVFRSFLVAAAILGSASFGQPVPATQLRLSPEERRQGFSNRTVIAKPKDGMAAGEIAAAELRAGEAVRRAYPRLGDLRVLEPKSGESVQDAIERLRASGRYDYVEPDFVRRRHASPNDPRFANGEQWYLRNTGQDQGKAGADIGAPAAWDIRSGAGNVIVAVLDTGIRTTHEDLAANLWVNPDEIPGNGLDDDKNGYVDDVHGINSLAARDSRDSGNPEDDYGHGTAVAGVIGAAGNNGKGISGAAWQVKLMALKWDDAEGSATVSNEIECIDYALAKGARILNISYGSFRYSQAEFEAIKRARDAGAIVVASAGNDALNNDTVPLYPANYLLDNVLSVASTDRNDTLSASSSYGTGLVELAAPGASIVSTDFSGNDSYAVRSGTSFSAPLVAGALALVKAQYPSDTYHSLIHRVLRGTDPLPALSGKVRTGGRLNLARALAAEDRPFNDDFGTPAVLDGYSVVFRGHTRNATPETGEPAHAQLPAEGTVWYSWTAPRAGLAVIETAGSAFDTVVAVYTGSAFAALQRMTDNDDAPGLTTSRATFATTAGNTYRIAIGGKAGATGALVAALGFLPANDRFADAVALTGGSAGVYGFNTMATGEAEEPSAAGTARGRSVWYRWTAPFAGGFSFSVFAYGFDAVAAVYRGTVLSGLEKLDTASGLSYNETAYFQATAGTTYHFQIDSADGNTGYFYATLMDAIALPGYDSVDSSAAFDPASGTLYAADSYGLLVFANFNTGDAEVGELSGYLDVQSPAVAADGSMYIGDDLGYFYSYQADGTRRWRKDLGDVTVDSSAAIGSDGAVYVHTDDGLLHALYADGSRKWTAPVPGRSYSSPAIGDNGALYIGSDDQHLYSLDPLGGSLRWRFKADGEIYASPAIGDDGAIYFGTLNGVFYALNEDGTRRWSYTAGGAISSSAAIGTDGMVYFGSYDGGVYALTPAGTFRWKYATGDEIRASSPAIASDGTVYIGSYDGVLHAIAPDGTRRRAYATGAYIRSSPLIDDGYLYFGSGDTRTYIVSIGTGLAASPWPMHRQNIRRTGRRPATAAPVLTFSSEAVRSDHGGAAVLGVDAGGAEPLAFQWSRNGTALAGASQSTLAFAAVAPADTGLYTATVTNSLGNAVGRPAILGLHSTAKLTGPGTEFPDIVHPNGNVFDQILLSGPAAAVTADRGQVLRLSFVDLTDDIVQVEFSGAGTLAIVLADASGPAAPALYNQSTLYMKGHAGIVVSGADETTNLSVFSVGRANAVNQALFRADATYDGLAGIAFVAIASANGKFGGLRTANTVYLGTKGTVGVYAPGIEFTGPVFVGDIAAADSAGPVLMVGSAADVRITGGDLEQPNARAVQVSGLTRLQFAAGSTSHGGAIAAKSNRARLDQNGTDITAQIVANPAP